MMARMGLVEGDWNAGGVYLLCIDDREQSILISGVRHGRSSPSSAKGKAEVHSVWKEADSCQQIGDSRLDRDSRYLK